LIETVTQLTCNSTLTQVSVLARDRC